jgi:hypothetical protein
MLQQMSIKTRAASGKQCSKRQAATKLPTCDELTVLKPAKSGVSLTLSLVERPPLVVGMKCPVIKRNTGRRWSGIWSNRVRVHTTTGHERRGVAAGMTGHDRSTFMYNVGASSAFPLRCCCGPRHAHPCVSGGWRRLRALAGAAEAIAGGGSAWHRSCDDNKHFACIWPQRASIFARFCGFKKRPLGFSVLLQKKFKTVFPFNLSLCMDESSE